ncbi:MAG: Uma2 family endonuclease [Spirosomaceae bacterium]|nr:Uma2 family endonuclease [Spirosomataceae bacterium]
MTLTTLTPARKPRKVPQNLIREVLRGQPYYYKGYKSVMNGTKKREEIMGSSSLQSIIVFILGFFLKSKINSKLYWIGSNEAGLHLGHKNNLSTDIGLFLKEKVVLNDKYFEVAPELAIEVDVKIDTDKELDYIFSKSEEMMLFGTQKIVWIITKNKKIFVFSKGETTQIFDWDKDIQLTENINLNLQQLLSEEGANY